MEALELKIVALMGFVDRTISKLPNRKRAIAIEEFNHLILSLDINFDWCDEQILTH